MLSRSTDDLEVVVVGAGAAGIGAAMRLAAARVSFTVFEARGRVGGRAYTIADTPFPLDLGCGWLHSADRNPWTQIAAEAGFTIDRTLPAWGTQSFDLGFSAEDQDAFALASRRFHDHIGAIGPTMLTAAQQSFSNPIAALILSSMRSALMSTVSNSILSRCKTATVMPIPASTGGSLKVTEP